MTDSVNEHFIPIHKCDDSVNNCHAWLSFEDTTKIAISPFNEMSVNYAQWADFKKITLDMDPSLAARWAQKLRELANELEEAKY